MPISRRPIAARAGFRRETPRCRGKRNGFPPGLRMKPQTLRLPSQCCGYFFNQSIANLRLEYESFLFGEQPV